MIGDIVSKYESGNAGFGAVSTGHNDPGGASYGKYQLAMKTGTLSDFLRHTGYWTQLPIDKEGTQPFNKKWEELAATDPKFCDAQWQYIADTHYEPAHKFAVDTLGLPDTAAIDEAIWSISVQHGHWQFIIVSACNNLDPETATESDIINALYDSRVHYVMHIAIPQSTRNSLLHRYVEERQDVLHMIKPT